MEQNRCLPSIFEIGISLEHSPAFIIPTHTRVIIHNNDSPAHAHSKVICNSDSIYYTKRCIPYSIYLQIPTKMHEKFTGKNSTSCIFLLWKRSNNSYSFFAEIRAKYNNILSQVKTWCVYLAKKHAIVFPSIQYHFGMVTKITTLSIVSVNAELQNLYWISK